MQDPGDDRRHEVVVGPVLGFWFACDTVRDTHGYYGYYGYAKLCERRAAAMPWIL